MLSIGIRFGQGFDRMSTLKVLQSIPVDYDYDLLVIGTSPGAIACAREARLAGKKTAIIQWREYTPAEKEGFDENMKEMAEVLDIQYESSVSVGNLSEIKSSVEFVYNKENQKRDSIKSNRESKFHNGLKDSVKRKRKVRQSRLDLNNELFKRGKECLKMMQISAALGDVVENAFNSGWRLCTTRPPFSVNWNKMTEEIMNHVMKKNYDLLNELSEEGIEIIRSRVAFVDAHTVRLLGNSEEVSVTANFICIAPAGLYEFPKDVEGSAAFGISVDDFPRLSEPPGKTLIVGGTPEALECAGILACFRFPVTVVSRKKILQGCDSELTQMIILHLKNKGVKVMENTTLKSIKLRKTNNLLAEFESLKKKTENENEEKEEYFKGTEEFETVLFAVRRNVDLKKLELNAANIDWDPEKGKIKTNNLEETSEPNIYALGDVVLGTCECPEASELAGKLLGKRLFHSEEQLMDYSFCPVVIYTPIEYAFIGISEDLASYRFGLYCVDVYHGFFQPLDFVLPSIKEKCYAKIIVFKSSNMIIGMHIFGPRAGEIIQGFAAGMRNGLTLKTLQSIVGVPASNAQEFLKLKELRSHEENDLNPSEIILGVSKMNRTY